MRNVLAQAARICEHRPVRVKFIAATAVLVAIAIATVAAGLWGPSNATTEAALPDATLPIVVDRESIGGRCDDERTASQARSTSTPWCSITRALEAAPPGGTVQIRRGSYPLLVMRDLPTSITVRNFPSESPTLAGAVLAGASGLTLRGMHLTEGVLIDEQARGIRLIDNTITGDRSAVVLQDGASEILIEENGISAPQGSGVFLAANTGGLPIADVTIRGNRFDRLGVTGINARNFRNLVIEKNEITRVASYDGEVHPNALRTYGGGTGLTVRSNFIHDNVAQGFFIKDGKVSNVVLENNIIVRTGSSFKDVNIYDVDGLRMINNTVWGKGVIFQGRTTGALLRNNILTNLSTGAGAPLTSATENYNLITSGVSLGPNDITDDPQFVNPARLDYRLAAGSPAIDAGTSDQAPSLDRIGVGRFDDPATPNIGGGLKKYYDMGAREFAAGAG